MSKFQYQNQIYESYQKEILFLQKNGNKLLEEIKRHEIMMNRKKQQNLQPHEQDLLALDQMVKKLLRIIAFISSYRQFQMANVLLSYVNQMWCYQIASNYYKDILHRFMSRLNGRVRQLQLDRSIDFTVERCERLK